MKNMKKPTIINTCKPWMGCQTKVFNLTPFVAIFYESTEKYGWVNIGWLNYCITVPFRFAPTTKGAQG